jgi:RNA polymerase sigma factor (sigma-70 family)
MDMNEITFAVVQRAVAGERAAMEEIMRALERPFFNLALRMLLARDEAEDATQECLLRVATRLATFEGAARFSTWAWRVAVNRLLELRRRPAFTFDEFSAGLADGLEPEAPERPEDAVLLSELKVTCSRALLHCLDADDRIAFVLGEIMELEGPEAAEILDVPPVTFRKRLSRARQRLRLALEGSCGIVNPAAPCRCHRRLTRATALGRVHPGEQTTAGTLDVAALRERLTHHVEAALRAGASYRADPDSLPRRDLVRAALAPLAAMGAGR